MIIPDNGKFQSFIPGQGVAQQVFMPEYKDDSWLPIQIPGDIHIALYKAQVIPDPFYDQNENQLQWIEEKEWWYRLHFKADSNKSQKDERIMLICRGLDTFATLWLNGKKIGTTKNMFHDYQFDISRNIQSGETNVLAICFDPPQAHSIPNLPFQPWGINSERISYRKAQFSFGWDWAPRFPTIGVYRPIEIARQKKAVLAGIHFTTDKLYPENKTAVLSLSIDIDNFTRNNDIHIRYQLQNADGQTVKEERLQLVGQMKKMKQQVTFMLSDASLWWIHELGEPYLYQLKVELFSGKTLLDSNSIAVGIRSIELDQSVDAREPGCRFFRFILNGAPIFAKGANWIPADSFPGRLTKKDYEKLIIAAQHGNMNMLRVWGGGLYEHDDFYDLCDQMGILVWQDFMFSCATYPEAPLAFEQEVQTEAEYQVQRLRNHASLALWCGNNENQWIHDKTYWDQPNYQVPGSLYYNTILPQAVQELDGHTPYWPGSPYGGNDHNSMNDGDRHNWMVWHGDPPRLFGEKPQVDQSPNGVSYYNYAHDTGRFISEFGMHASPVLATLQRCMPPEQLYFHSPAMDHHNKDNPKNKGDNLMLTVTGLPDNLQDYIDYSMITQGEGLKFAIEHYRRRKPHCSGTLFWQLNDCWPALSWSVIDYYGYKKAGYYYAKRAFSPILASFRQTDNESVQLWFTNDLLQEITDTVIIRHADFSGNIVWEKTLGIRISPNSSRIFMKMDKDSLQADAMHYLVVSSANQKFPKNRFFFTAIKDLQRKPGPISTTIQQENDQVYINCKAKDYAFFVHIAITTPEYDLTDNYFDLEAGEERTLVVTGFQSIEVSEIQITGL